MTAISARQPEVDVSYDTKRGRKIKHFTDAYKARSWYAKQFKLGNKPSVHKCNGLHDVVLK